MQALKALVVTLGILIVIAFGFLAYGLLNKVDTLGGGKSKLAPSVGGFGETHVAIPKGARVVETRIGDGRLFLRLEKAGGGEAVLVIDPSTGRRIGVVHLVPSLDQ